MSDVLSTLKGLSSAEEFFVTLDVPFDPTRLGIARLHILKRMGQYLAGRSFDGMDDAAVTAACRTVLAEAYAEFLDKSPVNARLFKVLKDRDPAKPQGAFVSFESLFG